MDNKFELVSSPVKIVAYAQARPDENGRPRGARYTRAVVEGFSEKKGVGVNWQLANELLDGGETRCLPLFTDGLSVEKLANQLKLSPHTVENMFSALAKKLLPRDVRNDDDPQAYKHQVALKLFELGVLELIDSVK